MKVIKKRIIVFILCFTLFSCGFVHTDPVQEVKASATVAAVSFIILGLTAIGFNYYSQASASSLQNDIEIYASEHNTTSASFLNAFQSVVVDVAKNAVKFSAAQIYLLKEFANSLINRNTVSYEPITNNTFTYVPVYGYPGIVRLSGGQRLTFTDKNGKTASIQVVYDSNNINADFYLGVVSGQYYNFTATNNLQAFYEFIVFPSVYQYSGGIPKLYYVASDGSLNLMVPTVENYRYNNSTNYKYLLYSTPFTETYKLNTLPYNGSYLANLHLNGFTFSNISYLTYNEQFTTVKAFDVIIPKVVTGSGSVIPSYSVDRTVFDNIASDKDLVITSPDVIDKAVDNAIVRNPSATSVTADDVAAAIDGTAVGVIDPAAEDEEDRVIAPPISLDDDLAISQDSAITDTVVEDLDIGDPVPPPDPPPVIPEIDSALAAKFPFSIFSDFILIMSIFDEDPEAPVFNLGFTALGRDFQFTIDLSAFDSVASVVRTMELLAFIVGIIFVTIKFMQGGSD